MRTIRINYASHRRLGSVKVTRTPPPPYLRRRRRSCSRRYVLDVRKSRNRAFASCAPRVALTFALHARNTHGALGVKDSISFVLSDTCRDHRNSQTNTTLPSNLTATSERAWRRVCCDRSRRRPHAECVIDGTCDLCRRGTLCITCNDVERASCAPSDRDRERERVV